MHARLGDALRQLIADDLAGLVPKSTQQTAVDLVAQHVASTFVLVLNWWVDSSPMLTPDAVDEQFRGLIAPSLGGLVTQSP
jgi:hypothetical protein